MRKVKKFVLKNGEIMWVEINNVEVIPYTNQLKLLQEKAIDTNQNIPEDLQMYLKEFL